MQRGLEQAEDRKQRGRQLSNSIIELDQSTLAKLYGSKQPRVSEAFTVLTYEPELVDAVVKGGSLNDAYTIARAAKARKDAEARREASNLILLRDRHPDLAALVGAGTMTLAARAWLPSTCADVGCHGTASFVHDSRLASCRDLRHSGHALGAHEGTLRPCTP